MSEKLRPDPAKFTIDQEVPPDDKEKEGRKGIDALIVFGAGIRSDRDIARLKELDEYDQQMLQEPEARSRLRLTEAAKVRIVGAVEMFLDGQVRDVILTGGAVLKEQGIDETEAELMKAYFEKIIKKRWRSELRTSYEHDSLEAKQDAERVEAEVDRQWSEVEPHIILEDKATNTIENFAHTINHLNDNPGQYDNLAFMSNQFHTERIIQLANILALKGEGRPAESEILNKRVKYETYIKNNFDLEGNKEYRERVLEGLTESERKVVAHYMLNANMESADQGEKRWSRGLSDMPEYWLSNVQFINNIDHLRQILNGDPKASELMELRGVDVDTADIDDLKKVLAGVERKLPPEEWGVEKPEQSREDK